MRETRINLKHLLEDIRDSYPLPLEEAIIIELAANALDSGASQINFIVNPLQGSFTVVDNGRGMNRRALAEYHNIASTTKARGKGIGFAGIGAKLSLLIAESVITETRGASASHAATAWHLASETRAPWQYQPFSEAVPFPRGTAVKIVVKDPLSKLLDEKFIHKTVIYHYYPLFSPEFFDAIYRYIYKSGVKFCINNEPINLPENSLPRQSRTFRIVVGRRHKRIAGFGYLTKFDKSVSSSINGLAASTYGKVIKQGWEWVGLAPSDSQLIGGFVEIPALAEILTINKMDFLRDAVSLKKYYRFRKAIQGAIQPILEQFGEKSSTHDQIKNLKPITKEIERTLRGMLPHFPELLPLLGVRAVKDVKQAIEALANQPIVGVMSQEAESSSRKSDQPKKSHVAKKHEKRPKGATLSIGFEESDPTGNIARMVENKIYINGSHPAYQRSIKHRLEGYHTMLCVAWSLSHFLGESRSPQQFINEFLMTWGKYDTSTQSLFADNYS